MFNQFTF